MKKNLIKAVTLAVCTCSPALLWAEFAPVDLKPSVARVNQFMQKGKDMISPDFPYRMNLPASGQVAKNSAGIRMAETSQQLLDNNAGLMFFYKLFDHSMRVPHWHANATEVGVVLQGKMRVIIWEGKGKLQVFTVEKDGTWTIPPATLHALENVGRKDELTFLVSYNAPNAADRDFATAWGALPDEILERTLGLTAEDIAAVRKSTVNRLSLYDPAASPEEADAASPYSSNFKNAQPLLNNDLGSIRRVGANNTPMMQAMALQQTILKPGTMREPHWYVGTNTFLYVYKGSAFFTMMDDNGKVYNAIVKPGDVIYIPVGVFHAYINIEDKDLEIYESFTSSKDISEITLLNGAQNLPARTLSGAVGISKESAERIINKKAQSYILPF